MTASAGVQLRLSRFELVALKSKLLREVMTGCGGTLGLSQREAEELHALVRSKILWRDALLGIDQGRPS